MNAITTLTAPALGPVAPLRSLVLLTVGVLLAHGLLLGGLPETFTVADPPPQRPRPMQTRALPPAASAVSISPAPAPQAKPQNRKPKPAAPANVSSEAAQVLPTPGSETPAPSAELGTQAHSETSAEASAVATVPPQAALEPLAPPEPALPPAPPAPPAAPATQDAQLGPVQVAAPVKLSYEVDAQARGLPYSARGELVWSHDGERYEARFQVSLFMFGSRSQTSVGRLGDQGLEPTRFGDRSRSEQAAHFDRERGRISFSTNAREVALLPGAQDRLSLFLQLGALLAGDPARYPPGSSLSLQAVGPREAPIWLFTVEGEETLQLAGQSLPSVKLVRLPRNEYDNRLELWMARNLSYLPVRMRISQGNGDFIDQQLKGIEAAPSK